MDLSMSFPLILVVLTGSTGLLWLLEIIWLRPRREAAARGRQPAVVEYAISFFPVLLFVLVLRSFLVEPFQIPSGSMKPTLQVGDFILVNKFIYGIRLPVLGTKVIEIDQPERGDSMVFIPSHKNQYFIKRVIGLPGDRVRYQNKVIYINNVEQNQKYLGPISDAVSAPLQFTETLDGKTHAMWRNRYEDPGAQEWLVPEGHYFMMGDNRDQSSDSRFWGFVREDKIVGKAFAIWLHKEPGLAMPTFGRNQWID